MENTRLADQAVENVKYIYATYFSKTVSVVQGG